MSLARLEREVTTTLSLQERVSAGLACSQWWRVFWNTAIWSHITVTGNSMCSWQYSIASRDYEVNTMCVIPPFPSLPLL